MKDLGWQDMKQGSEVNCGVRIGAEVLFVAHASFIASFLRRLSANESDVDDLVQDVFLVAHRKGGYLEGAAKPRTWLAAIAVRVMQNRRRTLARRREDGKTEQLDEMASVAQTPVEAMEHSESLERVQTALNLLDEDHRAVFLFYEIEGESCQKIADLLEIPVGTVYSRLHKARRRFREAYESVPEPAMAGVALLACFLGAP